MATVRVFHKEYGCDSGCCGHVVELTLESEALPREQFEFECLESREEAVKLAKEVVRERWPECFDSVDWDSLEFIEGVC